MSIEIGIWKINNGIKKLAFSPIESENKLEETLREDISILSEDLLLIGNQIRTAHGKIIDMLAIDQNGSLIIIELKKEKTPRDVVAQALDYASWVQDLSYEEILSIYKEKNDAPLEKAFDEKYESSLPDKINESHKIMIVSAQLNSETERIINYLADNFGVPINAVFFRYFEEDGQQFITRSWLMDPDLIEDKASHSKNDTKKEKWNNQDFVVNFEDKDSRSWEDAREYGFIAAGNGRWYSKTLNKLYTGARIFCMIPKSGYVGIGEVIEEALPIKDVTFTVDNEKIKMRDLNLRATNMFHDEENLDKCEYIVKVKWLKTIPKQEAYWIKGLKANQNSAYKLTNQYTIDKVSEFFKLDGNG